MQNIGTQTLDPTLFNHVNKEHSNGLIPDTNDSNSTSSLIYPDSPVHEIAALQPVLSHIMIREYLLLIIIIVSGAQNNIMIRDIYIPH